MNQKYFTVSQAANLLSVTPYMIRRLVETGRLVGVRTPGNHRRITAKSVEALLSEPKPLPVSIRHDFDTNTVVIEIPLSEKALAAAPAKKVRSLTDQVTKALNTFYSK